MLNQGMAGDGGMAGAATPPATPAAPAAAAAAGQGGARKQALFVLTLTLTLRRRVGVGGLCRGGLGAVGWRPGNPSPNPNPNPNTPTLTLTPQPYPPNPNPNQEGEDRAAVEHSSDPNRRRTRVSEGGGASDRGTEQLPMAAPTPRRPAGGPAARQP